MLLSNKAITRAGALTVEWVRAQPSYLMGTFFVCFFMNRHFEFMARELYSSTTGPWQAQMGQFAVSVLQSLLLLVFGTYFLFIRVEKIDWGEFLRRFTAPLTAESLRAITQIILWSLVFLIPGIIMYCRLIFVPYIILFDPTYKERPDAVLRSKELTRGSWLRLTLLIIAMTCFSAIFELGPNWLLIDDVIVRLIFGLCSFLFSLFGFALLYIIFENLLASEGK